MSLVTSILRPADLVSGIAVAVETATLESLNIKKHEVKLDKKRIDRAQRIVEILVTNGILGVEPEQTFEPDSVGSTGDVR